jgi:hypothetical protein
VHELGGFKILVGVKELRIGEFALSVGVVAVDVPFRIAGVCVLAEVIRRVGDYQLRLAVEIFLEILEMVVE